MRCCVALLFLLAVARAQGDGAEDPKLGKLSVTGSGTVKVVPDTGLVDLTIQTTAESVQEACSVVSQAASAVQAAVTEAVEDAQVSTVGIGVSQNITYSDAGQQFNGYICTNSLNVKVVDGNATMLADAVSATVDAAIEAGGNLLQVGNTRFELSPAQRSRVTSLARTQAVDNAGEIAETLAKAAKVTLGPIKTITDSNVTPPAPIPMAEAAAPMDAAGGGAAAKTPVTVGEQEVMATVSMEYSFTNE